MDAFPLHDPGTCENRNERACLRLQYEADADATRCAGIDGGNQGVSPLISSLWR